MIRWLFAASALALAGSAAVSISVRKVLMESARAR